MGFSLVVVSRGYSSLGCMGFSFVMASLVAQALGYVEFSTWSSRAIEHRLNSYDTWALLPQGIWDLPRLGIEPMSSTLAGGFVTPESPGKPSIVISKEGAPGRNKLEKHWVNQSCVSYSVLSNHLQPHGLYIACQAPLSMGFSRQGYWNGLPCSSPGDLPDSGMEPGSPVLQADSLPSEPPGKGPN